MMQTNMMRPAAAAAFAVLFLAVLQNAIHLKKLNRGRQILLPLVAFIYAVCGTVGLCLGFHRVLLYLGLASRFAGFETVLMNLLLAVGFLGVKIPLRFVLSGIWKNDRLMEITGARFYEYDEARGNWFLKKEWAGIRLIMTAFFWCSTLLSALFMALSVLAGNGTVLGNLYFPCAVTLVLCEIAGFFGGQTREEFTHSVSGENTDFCRISNYHKLREIYEKLFPKQVLSSHSGCEYAAGQGAEDLLKKMEAGDRTEQNTAVYFRTYDQRTAFDPDCIQAVNGLMHGKNMVFFNPFYRDLEEYLTFPLVDTLLRGKHCLVIAGRTSTSRDAEAWIPELLQNYTHLRSMWRVSCLVENTADCEIGILDFCSLYDPAMIAANRKFLGETGFVLMLEPSVMLNTGQIALSLLSQEMSREGNRPVYAICDRRTDGLIDTMSHLLQTEFVDASAMPVPRCIYTGMTWNAGGDYQRQRLFDRETRFLGNGLELAAAAVRNKIPQVVWYGETKAPMKDIRWLAGQYYPTICRYMNLPVQQKSLDEKLRFAFGLWSSRQQKEQFVIVEDEFNNMFSTMRAFLSRGKEQSFVNVLTENYMLRDYMRYNQQMFLTDPEVVPSLAPDYAKTERNVLIRLFLMMTVTPVKEAVIKRELELAGCKGQDIFSVLSDLITRYTSADNSIITIRTTDGNRSGNPVSEYSIRKEVFDRYFRSSLKNAYFIVEDEKKEQDYVDAKFFGHITQIFLPGQFVTYDGKYYEVKEVSPENGTVLRRASDLYNGRRYYRQKRVYRLQKPEAGDTVSSRNVMGLKVQTCVCDLSVETLGYLDLQDLSDLQTAKLHDLREDPNREYYSRRYRRKSVLRIELPGMDEDMRYTMALLLSELFRTVFPGGWPYLAVLAKKPESLDEKLSLLTYDLEGTDPGDALYIVEDSELDLGLLGSVVRNLPRLFEILEDYLSWHLEKLEEKAEKEETDYYPGEHFFLFGADRMDGHLKLAQVRDYLHTCGSGTNPLSKARKREEFDAAGYDLETVNTCDFCGAPLSDVSYERLKDGRIRCNDCGSSAVETVEEFREIFKRSLSMMEIMYGMKLHAPVDVQVADAAKIARQSGRLFKPGTHFASRAVGFARKRHGCYSIMLENGSPRLAAIDTMVHELTHIWQYQNWKEKEVKRYTKMRTRAQTKTARDILYEGMASWASVQYLYQIGETYYASRMEQLMLLRIDARGVGFSLYRELYPFVKDMTQVKCTPFDVILPVEEERLKEEAE